MNTGSFTPKNQEKLSKGWGPLLFDSRRSRPALIMSLILLGSLFLIYFAPSNSKAISIAAFGIFEFALGTMVVYIGGLWAVDLLPIKAAGSVKGIIGIFSYIGAATQDWISGMLIDGGKTVTDGVTSYNFDAAFAFWIGAAVIAVLVPLTLWKNEKERYDEKNAEIKETK